VRRGPEHLLRSSREVGRRVASSWDNVAALRISALIDRLTPVSMIVGSINWGLVGVVHLLHRIMLGVKVAHDPCKETANVREQAAYLLSGRDRINVHLAYELRQWARKFAVTPEDLKAAVNAVGDNARKVEEHLNGAHQGHSPTLIGPN